MGLIEVYECYVFCFQIDRGYLTLEDFKKAFKQVAPKLSERIILEVFR